MLQSDLILFVIIFEIYQPFDNGSGRVGRMKNQKERKTFWVDYERFD